MNRSLSRGMIVGLVAASVSLTGTTRSNAAPLVAPSAAPSPAAIAHRLAHTEIGTSGVHFRQIGKPVTIADGRGTGTLTAVIGGRYPTADGKGQVVFFWHGAYFVGLSANYETTAVASVKSPAPGTFVIRYLRYKASDPMCCPTLKPRVVTYGWSGHILISNAVPPKMGTPVRVHYQP